MGSQAASADIGEGRSAQNAAGPTCTPKRRRELTLAACEAVIDLAAALFNVPSKELRQTGRSNQTVARIRQIAMYCAHTTLGLTQREVGCGFCRDRTTVLHAVQVVENLRDDIEFDGLVTTFERILKAAFSNLCQDLEAK